MDKSSNYRNRFEFVLSFTRTTLHVGLSKIENKSTERSQLEQLYRYIIMNNYCGQSFTIKIKYVYSLKYIYLCIQYYCNALRFTWTISPFERNDIYTYNNILYRRSQIRTTSIYIYKYIYNIITRALCKTKTLWKQTTGVDDRRRGNGV